MPGRTAGLGGFAQVTDCLYIGNSRAAGDSSLVRSLNITCVINATRDASGANVPGVEYVHVPVADDPESGLGDYFDSVADEIRRVGDGDGRVLLHCKAGVSRSAALCLAYLMKHRRLTLAEAHALLRSLRPIVRPNGGFWRQLIEYEHRLHGKNTVSMIDSPVGPVPDLYERETRGLIAL
ncbi:dual specificity protein phosphatase 18 [Puntigrus tetrazona]|uniref:dual specificity protein phosphatase 18 n=1 Tax=Puntigrus tetrazona TaxID=1606681 RepID=UPI001C8AD3B5|nr:dual specificity protein phosphatase 18 [Puntigrus tetrazona]